MTLAQVTRTASLPVDVPGLPGDLDAYPVYRIQIRDGRECDAQLLRLEVRTASARSASAWHDTLGSLDPRTRDWLLKNAPGRAKRITKKLGLQTIELLYRWCAAGIVIFDVEPPANRGASHGPLIGWRLTALVQAHAQEIAHDSEVRRGELTDEAKSLATRLDDHPHARLLARILVAPCDLAYLEHALSVARIVAAERPPLTGHESSGTEAACTRFVLSRLARGWVKDYSVDPEMIEPGGQGVVYGATHKATQARVAFKRVRIRDDDTLARMRREIEAGYLFGEHPNVMPVLDADPEAKWFIMPLAAGTAKNYASELRASGQLRLLITAVCEALRAPHQMGWIHRDLKPENLLLLDNQWTVADWGLGRRPRGATSNPARTRTGTGYGTEGFAAPELSLDAHQAGPPADIYSLGFLGPQLLHT